MKEFLLFGKGFKKVDQWQDGCWVNICSPTQDDINYMEGLGVPDSFISDIRDPNERPRVERDDDWMLTIMRIPRETGDADIPFSTVPLGVIGIIYEARPNVTSDAAALCLKAGNAVILRGGKEAINSNKAVAHLMRAAVEKAGLPADTVNLIEDTSRESANELMKMNGLVDVLIPRGGAGLIKSVVENSTVPVIETGSGNCHIYIDEFADIDMAADIVFNAKTSRPSVCNACESVLVHKAVAEEAIVAVAGRLKEKNVEIFGDEIVCAGLDFAKSATEEDWGKEYLDYKISIKTVDNIDEAIAHIAKYSTGHSESIITENYLNAQKFLNEVDSAAVYVNASTRFTDGGEFGFGAEIGISTQKLHARGPLGLNNLTSEKYVVYGSGQIR